jgi:recombination protein RecA
VNERERQHAIDVTLSQLEKQFGRGSVLRLGSRNVIPVTVIRSGSISLDAALGVGGFPRGRVVEIFGPESSGKTTLALQVVAQAQKSGGTAAFLLIQKCHIRVDFQGQRNRFRFSSV